VIGFVVAMKNAVTAPAQTASRSMLDLQGAVKRTQGELAFFNKQLGLAKQLGDIEGYRKYTALVGSHRQQLFNLNTALSAQSGATKEVTAAQWAQNAATAAFEALDPVTLVLGLAAAATAAAGAFALLAYKGAALAIEAVSLRNRLTATFDALGSGPAAGQKTLTFLDTLSAKLPQTREELAGWAKTYMAMGMTDLGQLRGQLVATASASALMGSEGVEAFQTLSKRIQEAVTTSTGLKIADRQLAQLAQTGVNVADVAAQMGMSAQVLRNRLVAGSVDAAKFGAALNAALAVKGKAPIAQVLLDLPSQIAKAKEAFTRLFEGVDVKPFLVEVRSLFGILDQGKASGQALKFGITGGLNALMKGAAEGTKMLKHFFLEVEIGALRTYIPLKPLVPAFQKLFGSKSGIQGTDIAVRSLAKGFFLAVQAITLFFLPLVKLANVGGAIVDGILNGITGGVSRVVAAAEGLGTAAIDAVKNTLGIHSPSRVMLQVGGHVGSGFAGGIRGAEPAVRGASAGLGVVAAGSVAGGARSGAAMARATEGKRITIDVGGIHLHGAGNGALELTEEAVALLFERLALAEGVD
jgi:hypothetical protein